MRPARHESGPVNGEARRRLSSHDGHGEDGHADRGDRKSLCRNEKRAEDATHTLPPLECAGAHRCSHRAQAGAHRWAEQQQDDESAAEGDHRGRDAIAQAMAELAVDARLHRHGHPGHDRQGYPQTLCHSKSTSE